MSINLARGRPVTISDTPNATYPEFGTSVLRDGDSDWTADVGSVLTDGASGGGGGFTQGMIGFDSGTDITFALDLGSAQPGSAINAFGYYGTDVIGRPLQAKLESSDNGSSWSTVEDRSGLTAGGGPGASHWIIEFDISAAGSHRYWRLTLERDPDWLFISEIEFWS